MFEDTKNPLEKILLAGIGAMAITGEKAKEVLDDLVKKGELTVEQGKNLNEELRHVLKDSAEKAGSDLSDLMQKLERLSKEQREALRTKLQEMEREGAAPEE